MTEKFSRGKALARSLRPYLAASAGYLGLTAAALWALVARFTTAIPGVAGQFYDFAPLMDALVLPVYAVAGPASAVNAWIVGSLVFDRVALFAYLRHQRVATGLAFLGGAFFALSPAALSRVSFAHLNLVTIGWLPLSLLAWDHLIERRKSILAADLRQTE